jgi:hypothetical protein
VPRTHQFLVTLTVHTNKINPATTPTATSAASMKNGHPVVVIQRDGQHCSRRVIGWAIDDHLCTDLVESAVSMAVAMRGALAERVILHADYAEVCVKPRIC